ncbi:MAG: FCD domain-containing protein [Burkholderiaceae bacterium]|nr:FCD domain-containing protein [Burkholderiaceae bacterium]
MDFLDVTEGSSGTGTDSPPRTLIETAYRQLRRDIIDGNLAAGSKLPVEHLKDRYQVGAGTLREALGLLVADSLVVSQGQRGFRVAPMSLQDLQDLTRTRTLVECEALKESMLLGRDDWEASVVSAFHTLTLAEDRLQANAAGAFDDWEARNRQFHEALISACTSSRLKKVGALLYQQSERYRRISAVKGPLPVEVHEEHRSIHDAALARNVPAAISALTTHIHRSLSVITSLGLLK